MSSERTDLKQAPAPSGRRCRWRRWVVVSGVVLGVGVVAAVAGGLVVWADLGALGAKPSWSRWDRARVSAYLECGTLVGRCVPPVGPAGLLHHGAVALNAFIDGEHPPRRSMRFLRRFMLRDAAFRAALRRHERQALRRWEASGHAASVSGDHTQRFYLTQWPAPLFDDWAMCLRTDVVEGAPRTGFFVWGLGVVTDERAPEFFGRQLEGAGAVSWLPSVPLDCFNRLESEGLAEGYWINLTESPETSFFSSGSERMSRQQWSRITGERHREGRGRPASEL